MELLKVHSDREPEPRDVTENRHRLADLLQRRRGFLSLAIDTGNGSRLHHEGELAQQEDRGRRIDQVIHSYRIGEPIDPRFVEDMMDLLKAFDYFYDNFTHNPQNTGGERAASTSDQYEAQNMSEIVAALVERNVSES